MSTIWGLLIEEAAHSEGRGVMLKGHYFSQSEQLRRCGSDQRHRRFDKWQSYRRADGRTDKYSLATNQRDSEMGQDFTEEARRG